MTNRQIMEAILSGEKLDFTPQWIMSFSSIQLAKKLLPEKLFYYGYEEYPDEGYYPFKSMGKDNLVKEQQFNRYIDRCAFPIGWGANAAFGHGGPGEFNKKIIESKEDYCIIEYETGAKKEIRYKGNLPFCTLCQDI